MTVTSLRLDPKAVYRLLTDSACSATVLHIICLAKYGEDIYQVEPLELYLRLEEDFGAKLPEENENKLSAILLATATDVFYQDPEAWRGICNTLSEGDPGLDYLEAPTLAEQMWALYEVELNHGPAEMSPVIQRLMGRALDNETDDLDSGEDPYGSLKAFMLDNWHSLARQLAELGVPNREIPPLDPDMAGLPTEPALLQ